MRASVSGPGIEGLRRAEERIERTAERLATPRTSEIAPPDEVNLSEEMVNLAAARDLFMASLKAIETAEETQQHLLDILA